MKVKKKHLTGEIADFPKHVVQAMVNEQVRQGNPADPSVFAASIWDGFRWRDSEQGHEFWSRVIRRQQFHLIPKPEKPKGHVHAEAMRKYAKDAKDSATPWEFWELRYEDYERWLPLDTHPRWTERTQYRRKIETQDESKEPPTPNELIQAMLKKDMVVWAGVSNESYEAAREQLCRCVQRVIKYDERVDLPIRTPTVGWKYAVPINLTALTEITEVPK